MNNPESLSLIQATLNKILYNIYSPKEISIRVLCEEESVKDPYNYQYHYRINLKVLVKRWEFNILYNSAYANDLDTLINYVKPLVLAQFTESVYRELREATPLPEKYILLNEIGNEPIYLRDILSGSICITYPEHSIADEFSIVNRYVQSLLNSQDWVYISNSSILAKAKLRLLNESKSISIHQKDNHLKICSL